MRPRATRNTTSRLGSYNQAAASIRSTDDMEGGPRLGARGLDPAARDDFRRFPCTELQRDVPGERQHFGSVTNASSRCLRWLRANTHQPGRVPGAAQWRQSSDPAGDRSYHDFWRVLQPAAIPGFSFSADSTTSRWMTTWVPPRCTEHRGPLRQRRSGAVPAHHVRARQHTGRDPQHQHQPAVAEDRGIDMEAAYNLPLSRFSILPAP